jgi:RNA polymerase sigma factor (sigma-70 family)
MEPTIPDLFKNMFQSHYPSVRRKLVSLVRDEAIAEDLTQEVFLRLYRNPPDDLNALGAWLHRVLTRIGYDYLNKKTREKALLEKQEQFGEALQKETLSNEDVMIHQLDREEVQDWLKELSERDRKVLMLRYSGYSYSEIAEQLEVRLPIVGTLVQRATTRLKRQAELHEQEQWSRGNIQ